MLGWAIPTLCTLKSDRLEYVALGGCVIDDLDAVRMELLALDRVLSEGPGIHTLQRVEVMNWSISLPTTQDSRASDDYVRNFLQEALPTCYAHKLLYDSAGELSIPSSIVTDHLL